MKNTCKCATLISVANPLPGVADSFGDPKSDAVLTRAIVDTIREPLIVLNSDLRVVVASKSFYETFGVSPEETLQKKIYDLGNGQWNIPALRLLLEQIIPQKKSFQDYEVEHEFPSLGRRIMWLNGQEVRFKNGESKKILLSISDVTEKNRLAEENRKLIQHKDILLAEMRHRIANSLQLIASILLLKADAVKSEESRLHLTDAHQRIMSIATVQRQLEPTGVGNEIDVNEYLQALCTSLEASMIDKKPIRLTVDAVAQIITSNDAILLGLVTTELVINSLKHAFPNGSAGTIEVKYETDQDAWRLGVTDNGVGMLSMKNAEGLGTGLVDAMANQLKAIVEKETSPDGTTIWLTHHLATPLQKTGLSSPDLKI
ncbi:PAS domain-containing protein [Acetobacteraceae bacterium]|nr:PAS domain-containing protein [Candidatus Parcubacteria bacterium]